MQNVTLVKILLHVVLIFAIASPSYGCVILRDANGKIHRDKAAIRLFKHQHPCPTNNLKDAPCPGYVIDHVVPLCACGKDLASNMQWQTIAEGKKKDIVERKLCRAKKPVVK